MSRDKPVLEDTILLDKKRHNFIVADGVGGRPFGDEASLYVANTLNHLIKREIFPDNFDLNDLDEMEKYLEKDIVTQINSVNSNLLAFSEKVYKLRGFGSTLSLVQLLGNKAHAFSVGDSPIYLLRDGVLDYVNKLDNKSTISNQNVPELIRKRNSEITQYLGRKDIEVHYNSFELKNNDLIIISSDCLEKYLDIAGINNIALNKPVYKIPEALYVETKNPEYLANILAKHSNKNKDLIKEKLLKEKGDDYSMIAIRIIKK